MDNKLSSINDTVLKTVYEARKNDIRLSKARRSIEAKPKDVTQALTFLENEGYIKKNDDYYITTDDTGEKLHHWGREHIVTEKGIEYLETNNLI